MRYVYEAGIVGGGKSQRLVWVIGAVLLIVAIYILATYYSPLLITMPLSSKPTPDATLRKMQATSPADHHLYIPALNVDLPVTVRGDATRALASDAWQPDAGEPSSKGSIPLCAQRFMIGVNPWETHDQSPFFNLDRLEKKDQIYLDYSNKRYVYSVDRIYTLVNGSIPREAQNTSAQLILFSCRLNGHAENGTAAVEAQQIGIIPAAAGQ